MKIFLIDDEKSAALLLEDILNECFPSYEVVPFTNQEKFLTEFKKELPDVCFLDVEMPKMNGIDLAKVLNEIKPNVNIIFATGYSNYALEAMNVYASGYIMKPADNDEVINAMSHLRYPINEIKNIEIKTFGNFDISVDGKSINFRSNKSKELLAYLVDREGVKITRKEAASILYEESDYTRTIQKELCRIAQYLEEDLKSANIDEIFDNDKGYSINLSNCNCDLINYLKDKKSVPFLGEYMEQYSWGEIRKAVLDELNYED